MGVSPALPDNVRRFPVLSMTVADQSVFDFTINFVFVDGEACVSCGAQNARQKALAFCTLAIITITIARLKIVPNRVLLSMLSPIMAKALLKF